MQPSEYGQLTSREAQGLLRRIGEYKETENEERQAYFKAVVQLFEILIKTINANGAAVMRAIAGGIR